MRLLPAAVWPRRARSSLALSSCKRRAKSPSHRPAPQHVIPQPPFRYSYRRISTGNSRDAARAGKIVAAVAMPIATIAIHAPSIRLG